MAALPRAAQAPGLSASKSGHAGAGPGWARAMALGTACHSRKRAPPAPRALGCCPWSALIWGPLPRKARVNPGKSLVSRALQGCSPRAEGGVQGAGAC